MRRARAQLILAAAVAVSGCLLLGASTPPSDADLPGSSASPTVQPDYNQQLGTNRQAAEAAAAAGRLLFPAAGYWEVFVRTDPVQLPRLDPTRPSLAASPTSGVSSALLVVATESAPGLQAFRAGGHAHEQAAMTPLVLELARRFPGATIECDVYFGEGHKHARATLVSGKVQYTVLDGL